MNTINTFKGEHAWLSNFAACIIRFMGDDRNYSSVEHAYMSAKSDEEWWKDFCADPYNTAGQVKRRSKTITIREGWDDMKLFVMEECLQQKFQQPPYRELLVSTGTATLQEGNWWNDTFWGVDINTGKGENHLGKIIMKIRTDLQAVFPISYNDKQE